jgi:radical SAM protein with 4Fe4S-binding SPASM domain
LHMVGDNLVSSRHARSNAAVSVPSNSLRVDTRPQKSSYSLLFTSISRMNSIAQFAYQHLPSSIKGQAREAYIRAHIEAQVHLKRIRRQIHYLFRYGTTDFFEEIELEINTSCNRRCPYCPNSIFDRGLIENEKLMSIEVFQKVVNELSDIGYDGIISPHRYGEPLLDKRLPDLIRYTKDHLPDARIVLYSNGDFLDKKSYQVLSDSGISMFLITQHGKTMPYGIRELLGSELNVPIVFNELEELTNRGGLINVSPAKREVRPICSWTESVTIDYAGNVVLCCNDYNSSIIFGNVGEEDLLHIWNNPKYKRLRKELQKGLYDLPLCQKCVGR